MLRKMSHQIGAGVSVIFIIYAIAVAWMISQTFHLTGEWRKYETNTLPKQEQLVAISNAIGYGGLIHNFKAYLLRGDDNTRARAEASHQLASDAIQTYQRLDVTPTERQQLQAIQRVLDQYRDAMPTVRRLHNEGQPIADIDQAVQINDTPALQALDQLHRQNNANISALSEHFASDLGNVEILILLSVAYAFLSLLAIWAFVNYRLLEPITALIYRLTEMASITQSSVSTVCNGSSNLASGTNAQTANLEEISSSMHEIDQGTKINAESARKAFQSVQTVAESVRQTASNARLTAELSGEAQTSVESGAQTMNQIAQAMSEFRTASERIANIVDVINEITHQTKMLATNAAIEAARAGEHGKGFAVVADEVSKLAENSKNAAKEIADVVREGDLRARAGVEKAEKGSKDLQQILEQFGKVAETIQTMLASADEQNQRMVDVESLMESIEQSSQQQAESVDQVTRSVVKMERLTQESTSHAHETASSAQKLGEEANRLETQIRALSDLLGLEFSAVSLGQETASRVNSPLRLPEATHSKPFSPRPASLPAPTFTSTTGSAPKKASPAQRIPMRDDFSEF
jgi:methyl-accepting chemotaxis protein